MTGMTSKKQRKWSWINHSMNPWLHSLFILFSLVQVSKPHMELSTNTRLVFSATFCLKISLQFWYWGKLHFNYICIFLQCFLCSRGNLLERYLIVWCLVTFISIPIVSLSSFFYYILLFLLQLSLPRLPN